MKELLRSPASRLQTVSFLARWLLWLLLLAWFVFAIAWGALYWIIVPRIGEFRPQLEDYASQALGLTVRIGAIEARAEGLMPSFELRDVQLMDNQGRQALRLHRVIAAVSPRSLWNLGFEQVYIDRPQLDIRRTVDGRLLLAGLDISTNEDDGGAAADWFFSQTEFVVRGGSLTWTDELKSAPVLVLQQVDMVIRNTIYRHAFRVDATPPAEMGNRFTLRGKFQESLLSGRTGDWRTWEGQIYALFEHVDVAPLRRYTGLGVDVDQGVGALRAWLDVKHGQLAGATADVALARVRVHLIAKGAPLVLPKLTGRLAGRVQTAGFELATHNLQFELDDGVRWPGGNVAVKYVHESGKLPAQGELKADTLDLAALSRIAARLPFDARLHEVLAAYAPKGRVERLQGAWKGALNAPLAYEAKGRVVELELAAQTEQHKTDKEEAVERLLSPGVQGASIDFDLNHAGGRASLALQDGQLALPTLFDEPVIPFTHLSAGVQWKVEAQQLAVQVNKLAFSNADMQGEAQLKWKSDASAGRQAHLPGQLDLQGSMTRVDLAQLHRYLPRALSRKVRDYLRDAISQGQARGVRFTVRGNLRNLPFSNPKDGELRISAQLHDTTFVYVPRGLQKPADLPWPAFTGLSGDLLMEHAGLQLKNVSAGLEGAPGLRFQRTQALIPDLLHDTELSVNAQAQGPLGEALQAVMKNSPVAEMTGRVLAQAHATGQAQYQFNLKLPLREISKTSVQGRVTLAGNDLKVSPGMPPLTRMRATVHFSEQGFAISAGQAHLLGGELLAEGGTIRVPGADASAPAQLRLQGRVTAEGMRQAPELGALAQLAQRATGGANYHAVFGIQRGAPQFRFDSSLQGLALNLPAPLNKTADAMLALRLESGLTRESLAAAPGRPLEDRVTLSIGQLASAIYVRNVSGSEARVLRGALDVGQGSNAANLLPDEGVVAHMHLDRLDIDEWRAILSPPAGHPVAAPEDERSNTDAVSAYVPDRVALEVRELVAAGHRFSQFVVGASREERLWRANLDAHELSGYVEYQQPRGDNDGHVYARLARLSLAPAAAKEVENLLNEQPASIPALDIVVDDMELRGKKLGRVEIEAVNRGASANLAGGDTREWRLNKFNVITPQGVFTASGNWAVLSTGGAAPSPARATDAPSKLRRTVMNFRLELADAGGLLGRLGMKDVIGRGKGRMEGAIAWVGSPLALDYPTLTGAFNVNVETGQFLKVEPGMAKLLGVLSLQSLPRRLVLDFRDVFSDGFAFDFVRGDVTIDQGVALSNNLQMKGVNAAVLMEGKADIAKETQDLKVVVVPEINAGTASLIATWINPVVGVGTFLAQLVLRQPLIESATQQFHISGSWADPKIERVDNKREAQSGVAQ